jgi:hypothetical protein
LIRLNVARNGRPAAMYSAGEYGLYAAQFHSGLNPVWLEEIQAIGAVYYSPLPPEATPRVNPSDELFARWTSIRSAVRGTPAFRVLRLPGRSSER